MDLRLSTSARESAASASALRRVASRARASSTLRLSSSDEALCSSTSSDSCFRVVCRNSLSRRAVSAARTASVNAFSAAAMAWAEAAYSSVTPMVGLVDIRWRLDRMAWIWGSLQSWSHILHLPVFSASVIVLSSNCSMDCLLMGACSLAACSSSSRSRTCRSKLNPSAAYRASLCSSSAASASASACFCANISTAACCLPATLLSSRWVASRASSSARASSSRVRRTCC
mmetsp:Transcript_1094/g.3498  ORF Transcript_1094/g.3498 Transcript_1094/m.3498 type:complete len:230 (+) Transcript_1094:69-758(+)